MQNCKMTTPWRSYAVIMAVGLFCQDYCSARPIGRQQHQQLQLLQQPLQVSFAELKPTVASIWVPSITTSAKSLQIPVSGLPGTPLPVDQMSRLVYTVTYKRKPAYVLQGTVNIAPTTAFSSTDQQPIQQPLVTLQQDTQTATIPDSKVQCNHLMVAAGSTVSCTFSTTIFALDSPPPAGTAQALIQLPGTGTHVQTPPMAYDFSSLRPASNLRLSSQDQMSGLLFDSLEKPPATTAIVSNYFENGNDVILPTGISGVQPPAESVLSDTKTYTYTALFSDVPRHKCGKKWKVLATASIESTSDGLQPPETATSVADLQLLGCNYFDADSTSADKAGSESHADCNEAGRSTAAAAAADAIRQSATDKRDSKASAHKTAAAAAAGHQQQHSLSAVGHHQQMKANTAAAGAAAASSGVSGDSRGDSRGVSAAMHAAIARPLQARLHAKHSTHKTAAAAAATRKAATREAAAEFSVQLTVKPSAVEPHGRLIQQHTTRSIKSDTAAAAAAAEKAPVVKASSAVLGKKPIPGNSKAKSGSAIAMPGPVKATANPHSSSSSSSSSSSHGKKFVKEDGVVSTAALPANTFMAVEGSTLCGRSVCSPGQTCMSDVICCYPGGSICGGSCCPRGDLCMNGRCMPPGSSPCGSTACGPYQSCLSGKCCDANAPTCGGTCCDGGQMCVNGQCAASGSSACGSTVCGPDRQCVGPGVCCGAGESQCGGTCCGGGNTCLNGRCVAGGSSLCAGQICGPGTVCAEGAICCPVGQSFCGGQCCGSGNQCVSGRCMAWGSTACGGNVCNADQSCQNGVCCNRGESGCGTGCCATGAGMQCIRNQCLPAGTQPCGTTTCPPGTTCGDPYRSLCCGQGTRACAGSCCPQDQVCSGRQTCVPWNSVEAESRFRRPDVDYIAGLEGPQPGYGYGYNPYGRK